MYKVYNEWPEIAKNSSKINNFKCIICASNRFIQLAFKVRDSKKHKILECKTCKQLQLFPIPLQSELKKYNDENLQDKNVNYFGTISDHRKKSIKDTNRRVNFVKKYISKKSKVLEIGSGHGFFLQAIKNEGYQISGIEISKEKKRILKKVTNAEIFDVDLVKQTPNIQKVNAIVLFHVLEHIEKPVNFLKNLKNLLRKNGRIIIEVPNSDDLFLRENQAYQKWYWQLAHISYFNPNTLKKSLKIAGYKQIEMYGIQRYSVENMFNWKLIGSPQLDNPTYDLEKNYQWLDSKYKSYLENCFQSDTIIAVASK